MDSVHNPDRYMSDLRQILSQGRKRIGLLIGAGAPLSMKVDDAGNLDPLGHALIPDIDSLSALVSAKLADEVHRDEVRRIRNELGGAANVEAVLSAVRLRASALGADSVNGLDGASYASIGTAISSCIAEIVDQRLPPQRNAYNELVSWISGTVRAHPVELFTTNYDLLLEEAFEAAHSPYFDGFTGGSEPFFDPVTVANNDLPPRWSRLWKLHGSIGWSLKNGNVVRGQAHAGTHLIYPDHLKYDLTQKQPYSALFDRLKHFVSTPDTLVLAVGFSFRDAHVSAILDEALAGNANAAVFAFQFGRIEAEQPAVKIAFSRPNFSVYASDGAVISGVPGTWRTGEAEPTWNEIRKTFWRANASNPAPQFILGDFASFCRFCALTQATEMFGEQRSAAPVAAEMHEKK